jgi:hypothetical protein
MNKTIQPDSPKASCKAPSISSTRGLAKRYSRERRFRLHTASGAIIASLLFLSFCLSASSANGYTALFQTYSNSL